MEKVEAVRPPPAATEGGLAVATMDGDSRVIALPALQAFKAVFKGPVLTTSDADYEATRQIWNAMIERRPALVARCTGTADVMQAVRFARQHGLLCSVRGGGHNIAGLALCEGGLLIDLSLMRAVWVDPVQRTAHAQGGCTLGDVDRETQVHGLAAVLGFVSATGIAGRSYVGWPHGRWMARCFTGAGRRGRAPGVTAGPGHRSSDRSRPGWQPRRG